MKKLSTILHNLADKIDTSVNIERITNNEIDTLFGAAGGTGTDAQDYVVEHGTSGVWKYRKWASGVSECWAIYGETLTSYAVPWQGASAFYTSVTFPTGLFVATPNMTTDFICDSVLAISCGGLHSLTATGTNLYGISIGATGSQPCTWNIRVVGRWK